MTDEPRPIGETLESVMERFVFGDEVTHAIRDQWEQTKKAEQEVFERVCREEYERRLDYHRICQTPDPAGTARRETNLCKILFREELDERLAYHWKAVLRKVAAVLEDKRAAEEDGQ